MADDASLVHVEIFGLSYAVRGADARHVERLGAFVDERMREVSRASGAVDSVRVAVLAALNIADELFRAREALDTAGSSAREKASRLAGELAAALGE